MEQIRNYVDAMFSSLPQTPDMDRMKAEMLCNLEEKYNALLSEGKNRYEVIGIILDSIGTVDDLREDTLIRESTPAREFIPMQESLPVQEFTPTQEQCEEYRSFKKKYSIAIACAVGLFIMSPVSYLIFAENEESAFTFLPMFLLIATGVGLCIYWESLNEYYQKAFGFGEKHRKMLISPNDPILKEYKDCKVKNGFTIAFAVALFILSPAINLIANEKSDQSTAGIILMFLCIAIGVILCILSGSREDYFKDSFPTLQEYEHQPAEENRFTGLFSGVIFLLATVFYLYIGFTKDLWHPGWIIFPICGILTGIVAMIEEFVRKQ